MGNDARLVWRDIAAPDLSAVSAALARANQAFNSGMGAGSSILDSYAAAVQAKADDSILSEIAGLKDEAAFQAFIDGGGLAGKNISDGMKSHILGMRSNFVKDEGVRANTDNTRASTENTRATTGINLAREARSASEWQDQMSRRDAERAAAGDIEAAREFASQYGDTVGPITEKVTTNTREMLARTLQAEAGNQGYQGMVDVGSVIRNRAASGKYGDGIQGVIMKPGQFSAWNSVTGYAGGQQGQNMDFTPSKDAYAAADAILSGNYKDETGGATHYYNPSVSTPAWGSSSFIRRGAHVFGNADGGGPVKGNTGAIAASDPYTITTERNSPIQNARDNLLKTGKFTAAEVDQMLAGAVQAGKERSDQLLAHDQKVQAELTAQAAAQALLDPVNTNARDMGQSVLTDPNLSPTQRQEALAQAAALAKENPDLLAPDPSRVTNDNDLQPNAELASVTDQLTGDLKDSMASRPEVQLYDDVKKFSTDDPAKALEDILGLGSDSQTPSDYDTNELRNMIRDYAKEFKVDEPVAAAAMRQAFERDPSTFLGIDLTSNTLKNRFDHDRVGQIIEDSLSQGQVSKGREVRGRASVIESQIAKINRQVVELQRQASKTSDPVERASINQTISDLIVQASAIRTKNSDLFPTK